MSLFTNAFDEDPFFRYVYNFKDRQSERRESVCLYTSLSLLISANKHRINFVIFRFFRHPLTHKHTTHTEGPDSRRQCSVEIRSKTCLVAKDNDS